MGYVGSAEDGLIRPVKTQVPQAVPEDLRLRILATRWPGKEQISRRAFRWTGCRNSSSMRPQLRLEQCALEVRSKPRTTSMGLLHETLSTIELIAARPRSIEVLTDQCVSGEIQGRRCHAVRH